MLVTKRYDRARALEYAATWATDRNPLYFNYTGFGGDCTNFVSQCVFAGSCQMNFTPVFGWYYLTSESRTASWTGVQFFYDFMVNNRGVGPFAVEVDEGGVEPGDVVQLGTADGEFYHTLFITEIDPRRGILVTAHSDDAVNRPLGTYDYAEARFIHMLGVRIETDLREDSCYADLLGGIAIRT